MKILLKIIIGIFLIGAITAAGFGYYAWTQLQPVATPPAPAVTFIVPKGQSIAGIGKHLQDAGLIRNALLFRFIVWQQNLTQKIEAGTFSLSPAMTPQEIAQQMTNGTNQIWVRVLEGWRTEEIADAVMEQDFPNFDRKQFLQLSKNDEGYLFPDSYLVQPDMTADTLHTLLRDNFDKKIAKLQPNIQNSGHSLSDIVIMASIVQREARDPNQMKIVASILWNRVRLGMGLDADSTLQYLKGYDPILKTWWPEPLADDKLSGSLFNTYKFPGLPPHPISNPGLDALQATIDAPQTDYLFYLHDRQGQLHYAKTLEEHQQNIQKYLN